MGVVISAYHLQLGQRVALKFLRHQTQGQAPEVVARFLREARAAAMVRSEHVARVTDVGTLDTGEPFLVMEYLEGENLAEALARSGPFAISDVVGWVLQVCEALAEAHVAGITHRDLKPANLFLARGAGDSLSVKVLDFGISKLVDGGTEDASLTATSAVMGSPLYMSPEQIRSSKNVDSRTDIWALGVILHELLTGAPVYNAETAHGLLAKIIADPPPPVRQLRRDVPAEVEAAILRCLEKEPQKRWESVAELAHALAPFAPLSSAGSVERTSRVLGRSPIAVVDSRNVVTGRGSETGDVWSATQAPRKRGLQLLAAGGIALVLALGVALGLAIRGSGVEAPASGAPGGSTLTAPPVSAPTPPAVPNGLSADLAPQGSPPGAPRVEPAALVSAVKAEPNAASLAARPASKAPALKAAAKPKAAGLRPGSKDNDGDLFRDPK
jgi:serine/threonine protein kinase